MKRIKSFWATLVLLAKIVRKRLKTEIDCALPRSFQIVLNEETGSYILAAFPSFLTFTKKRHDKLFTNIASGMNRRRVHLNPIVAGSSM